MSERSLRGGRRGRTAGLAPALAAGLVLLTGCAGATSVNGGAPKPARSEKGSRDLPGVGKRLRAEVPGSARQAVVVYGKSRTSPDSTVVLYRKTGGRWEQERKWTAHNGRHGWTTDHRQGDQKSPVGVFTLTDAGGVLPDPGARLPYHASTAFTPPGYWPKVTRHDFDYVIAIDYNRVRGTSPIDPQRPQGAAKGGGIWLHMDHGSGTSACVSLSKAGMRHLLRALDPALHPVIVMGDRAQLSA